MQNQEQKLEKDVGSFFKPIDANLLNNRNYKNVQTWVIGFIVFLSLILITLFFVLIIPNKPYREVVSQTQIIVRGTNVNINSNQGEPPDLATTNSKEEKLEVENVIVKEKTQNQIAKKLPSVEKQVDYSVKSGDNLEKIAKKFYGSASSANIQKIKTANRIKNSQSLQIKQRLKIPL